MERDDPDQALPGCPQLRCACEITWAAPDDRVARDVPDETEIDAPPRTQVPARPGHTQSFYVLIVNPSPVTQTILGLPPTETVAEPDHLAVAVDTGRANEADPGTRRFTTAPTGVPPGGLRWLRMSHEVASYGPGRTEFFSALFVRVKPGGLTRTETVSLDEGIPSITWG